MISRKDALEIFVDAVNSPNADVASIKSAAITFNKADENRGHNLYSIITGLKGKGYGNDPNISTMGERVYDFYKAYENAVEHRNTNTRSGQP